MKRLMGIQRILEDFKGTRNIPGINKNLYDDGEQDESEQELSEDENKTALMYTTTTPMR